MMSLVLCALPGHGDAPEIMNIPFRVLGKSTSTIQGCVSSSSDCADTSTDRRSVAE